MKVEKNIIMQIQNNSLLEHLKKIEKANKNIDQKQIENDMKHWVKSHKKK